MADETTNKIYDAQETNPSLPEGVVAEILSWLPVESLIVCKCVCRQWRSIIEEPLFIKTHMSRASPLLLCREPEHVDVSGKKFKVIHASEGLVLEHAELFNYRIKNPATRQVLCLPDPVKEPGEMFFHYVSGSMVYKLIHLHAIGQRSLDLGCEVLTVEDDLAWRDLNISSLKNIDGPNARLVFALNFDILYIIKIGKIGLDDSRIIWLDLVTECFSCVELPKNFFFDWNNVYPLRWKDNLSLATVDGDKLIIWVLESYRMNQWADREIIIPLTFLKRWIKAEDEWWPTILHGNILSINVNNAVCITYDIEKKEVQDAVRLPVTHNRWFQLCPSLVQLKGMQAEDRIEG